MTNSTILLITLQEVFPGAGVVDPEARRIIAESLEFGSFRNAGRAQRDTAMSMRHDVAVFREFGSFSRRNTGESGLRRATSVESKSISKTYGPFYYWREAAAARLAAPAS